MPGLRGPSVREGVAAEWAGRDAAATTWRSPRTNDTRELAGADASRAAHPRTSGAEPLVPGGLAVRRWMEGNLTFDYNPAHRPPAIHAASFLQFPGTAAGYATST